jgi:3'-phosphoadenosine 5'-phosphosulfate (PAPS) 3'-phosphatase
VLAEGATGDESFESSIEWQTAAAHAILGGAGMQLCHAESATELVYNKKDLSNPFITVGSADATALTTH